MITDELQIMLFLESAATKSPGLSNSPRSGIGLRETVVPSASMQRKRVNTNPHFEWWEKKSSCCSSAGKVAAKAGANAPVANLKGKAVKVEAKSECCSSQKAGASMSPHPQARSLKVAPPVTALGSG